MPAFTPPTQFSIRACRPIPSRTAISEGLTPSAFNLATSAACGRTVGTTAPCSGLAGDALPLTLQHDFTLGLTDAAEHRKHQPAAGARDRVQELRAGHREDAKAGSLGFEP